MSREFWDYFYVGLQLVLFMLYAFDSYPVVLSVTPVLAWVGLAVAVFGAIVSLLGLVQLDKSLTPFPSPKKEGELVRHGVYRWARHPIYAGILLFAFGYACWSASATRLVIGGMLLVLFFFKSLYEEKMLDEQYEEYQEYRQNTGRFGPWLKS
jgi:protein-S-isoprenylcysteine O-methyltransferase Ste14